ncbi:hypothetical protein IWW40_001720 [Coemansia sp. RSA 1250]|nr:hypothetical protein IWW40_001720 [Coemansia sp. RSA 1250]
MPHPKLASASGIKNKKPKRASKRHSTSSKMFPTTANMTASQYSMPMYHESSRHSNAPFPQSLPAAIPLPGSLSLQSQPPLHNASGIYQSQPIKYAPHSECDCSGCRYDAMDTYVHSVPPPAHSPSPPMLPAACSCCPPQSQYSIPIPYAEPAEPSYQPLAMSMPIPMPTPSDFFPVRQKPRKRVTFADPIAEIRVVPSYSSSAPENINHIPAHPHSPSSRRSERRTSENYSLVSDFNSLASSYTEYPHAATYSHGQTADHSQISNQGIGHAHGYSTHRHSSTPCLSQEHSKAKKRTHPCVNQAESVVEAKPRKSSSSGRSSHERRKSDHGTYAHCNPPGRLSYDERFSLSMAHLPLKVQQTTL